MAEQPLVSICIPAYNSAAYISDTIESILRQTYRNIELVVVDDCSTDETAAVLAGYAAKDERVKVYINTENLGMAGNWNKALSLARGDYIKLMGDDDMIVPHCIETEVGIFAANPSAVLVESDSRLVDLSGRTKGFYKRYPAKGLVDGKRILKAGLFVKDYFGAPQANLMTREAYEKSGGIDPDFTYIVDYDFYMKMAVQGDVYILHEPLNEFRVRKASNTGQVMNAGSAKNEIYVREHRHFLEKVTPILGLTRFEIGLSMLIRRIRCFMASVYLLLFVRK